MDPHSFIARAEAQRWLGIAEKLLMGHDLVGSKTFAIRARDSDPRLEAANQILAITDTLLAAEKQIVGSNGVQQPDFYAILQLVRFVQDTELIASQYRRLAVMLNPHQNRFSYSDQAFQLVNDAWVVLSNPMRKSMYDEELNFPQQQQMNTIGFNLEQQHHQQQQQQEQCNFFSINHMRSDHEQEFPDPDTFQTRVDRSHQQQQLQQHNFLAQVPPFKVRSAPHQQTQPPPQPPLSWPQASPLSQPQQSQQKQQQHLQPRPQQLQQKQHQQQEQQLQHEQEQPRHETQQEQQQQESLEQNVVPVQHPSQVNSNNGLTEEEAEPENVDKSPTFWTACPYCFYMYEYSRVYADCTLRCNNCKRAYQAVRISSPPSMAEGQEPYFYCWGYFPLGVSISHLSKNIGVGTNSKWTPFSPLYNASSNVHNQSKSRAAPKKNTFVNKSSGPRIYIDDVTDDIFTGISEPSDDSDVEWNSTTDKNRL